jgi:hypothetical protein
MENPVALRALKLLEEIKFQRSYTSGMSGAIKIPVGIEGGLTKAVALAECQLSMPEIIDKYRSFIHEYVRQRKDPVVIVIDEMDKMESDKKAQSFLNDIKALFNLRKCFYLIAVSESAMASFERRGIKFRDVFDSCFDDILYVDHMDLQAAEHLLVQRAPNLPFAFICLCFLMSGGLARDLIRALRRVFDLADAHPADKSISFVSARLVARDLRSKINAATKAARTLGEAHTIRLFITELVTILAMSSPNGEPGNPANLDPQTMIAVMKNVLEACVTLCARTSAPLGTGETVAQETQERISDLSEELATYAYYCYTVGQFFVNCPTEEMLERAATGNGFSGLACARNDMAIAPCLAREAITQFRSRHGLDDKVYSYMQTTALAVPLV